MMKNGFTLAEVLITLAVIGVIATLTLPNVMSNYQEKVMLTQLQKTYNLIKNTVPDAITKEGATKFSELLSTNSKSSKNKDFLRNYFETTALCTYEANDLGDCLSPTYTKLNGDSIIARSMIQDLRAPGAVACAVITSGATICVSGLGEFVFDINGKEKPNKFGKDVFWFEYMNNGKLALANETRNRGSSTYDEGTETSQLKGTGCNDAANASSIRFVNCLPYIISRDWKF